MRADSEHRATARLTLVPPPADVAKACPEADAPASLRVYRFERRTGRIEAVLGTLDSDLSPEDLVDHAREAMRRQQFMAYTVSPPDTMGDPDELCFVPRDGRCDILCIRTNGWRRHHGDHRRSLADILADLAGAVACGKLRILSATELAIERTRGEELIDVQIADRASVAGARRIVARALKATDLDEAVCKGYVLSVSEAVSNMLLHGGGHGSFSLRLLPDRLRAVAADEGPGLNFLNWMGAPGNGQTSMGYGLKIILDQLDSVGLYTGEQGTTLLLDREYGST
jgi:anti-sigma regulatory factor (Ser/Thr protein kinase)